MSQIAPKNAVNISLPSETQFWTALQDGDEQTVKQLLKEKKIDPNLRDQNDQPAVIVALRKGQISVFLQLLKDDRTKIDITSDNSNTLLHILIRKQPRDRRKFKDAISALLAGGLDVNAINKFGNTALHETLLNDINIVAIASLLKHKADMNIQNKEGDTPLFLALLTNREEIAKKFYKTANANDAKALTVPKRLNSFVSALLHTTIFSLSEQQLLKVLLTACEKNYENIVEYIISQMNALKLDINKYLSNDKTRINPIFAAINEGNFGIAKRLLSSGTIKTALTDADNNIVLIRLAKIIPKELQVDVYSALIDTLLYQMKAQGVDINHQNNAGETALHAAAFRSNNLAIQYIVNDGGDMMKQTLNGDTPLHYGVMGDSFETVRLLLKYAPSEVISVKNNEGRDPEELAKTLSATEFGGLFAGFKMKQKVANKVNIRIANLNAERTRLEIKSKVAETEIDKEKGIREKISMTIKEMADTSLSVQKQLMDLSAELNNQRYDWSATRSDPTEFVGRQIHMLRVVSELLGNASSRLIPMAAMSDQNTNQTTTVPKKQPAPANNNNATSPPTVKKAISSPCENRFSVVKPNAVLLNKPRATIAMHKVGAANSKVGSMVQKIEENQSSNTNQTPTEPRKSSDPKPSAPESPNSGRKALVPSKSEANVRKRSIKRDSASFSQDDDTALSRKLTRNKKKKKQSIDALDTFNMTEQIEAKLASSRKTHFDIIKPLRKSMIIEPAHHEVVTNRIITIQKIAHVVESALSLSKMLKLHNSHMESISSMMKKEITSSKKLLETLKNDSDLFAERIRAREELRILMNAFAEPLDQLTSILINDSINQSNMSEIDETVEDILQELTRKNSEFMKGVQKLHGLFTTEVSSFEYIFGVRMSDIESDVSRQSSSAVTKTTSAANLIPKNQRPSSGYAVPQIRVSSIDELIRDITGNRFDDLKVRDAFLLSYKNFLTSIELLYKLIERYCITPVEKDLSDDQLAEVRIEKQIPVRSRVLSLIKSWIEKYFVEFDNREFEHTFEEFIKGPVSEIEGEQYANALMSSFTTKKLERRAQVRKLNTIVGGTNLVAKTSLPSLNVNLEDPLAVFNALTAKEMVNQLTILGSDLFQAIKAEELFNQAWTKSDKAKSSPQVLALINHSNSISSWLIRTILSLDQLDKRVEALKKVVQMAEECVSLNNFDTMVAVMAALDNASISRLRTAWKEIDKAQLASLDRLRKLNENNWAGLRQMMRSAPMPLIPFLGMYLTDLTYAEEGNPVFMNGKINFTRNIIVAGIINELLNYQRMAHNIAPAMPVLQYLDVQLSSEPISDNEAYAISMQYDPRQNTQKKIRAKS